MICLHINRNEIDHILIIQVSFHALVGDTRSFGMLEGYIMNGKKGCKTLVYYYGIKVLHNDIWYLIDVHRYSPRFTLTVGHSPPRPPIISVGSIFYRMKLLSRSKMRVHETQKRHGNKRKTCIVVHHSA